MTARNKQRTCIHIDLHIKPLPHLLYVQHQDAWHNSKVHVCAFGT